jgi:hypothetical protein
MSKDFLGFIHTGIKGNIGVEFVVFPQSSILDPKSTKLGKLGIFNLVEMA